MAAREMTREEAEKAAEKMDQTQITNRDKEPDDTARKLIAKKAAFVKLNRELEAAIAKAEGASK